MNKSCLLILMVFELYFGFFVPFNYIEWYFKLTVPLSPTEIALNGPMVLIYTEWYSMVYYWLFL